MDFNFGIYKMQEFENSEQNISNGYSD